MKHDLIRPPKDAREVLLLSPNGQWHKDNGKPGLAFSGRSGEGIPMAWYSDCACNYGESWNLTCPEELAMEKAFNRFNCANGSLGYTVSLTDGKVLIEPKEDCHECTDKESPWFDEEAGIWVHTQSDGLIVTCEKPPADTVLQTAPLTRTRGQSLKDAGKKQVENNNRQWIKRMRWKATELVQLNGTVAIDQLRWHADNTDDQPKHPGAWGAVFNEDRWVADGHKESEYAAHRARIITVWKLQ